MSTKTSTKNLTNSLVKGLTREVVENISKEKKEPDWMLQKRLAALALYEKKPMPAWGPDLSQLDLDNMVYYVSAGLKEKNDWKEVPDDIRETFERLGIPQAEHKALSGAGAQVDADMVYHNLKEEWKKLGVIFENMDVAVEKYPELVKKYFMTDCVAPQDHKFSLLHAAAWSGGTFIYVPPGLRVSIPMQAYFRMNTRHGGQFEHTLIIADKGSKVSYIEGCSAPLFKESSLHAGCVEIFVEEGAHVQYSSIENWSKNVYNLNTKRALVKKNGLIEWINGNMGSAKTMLYPSSVLVGEGARSDSLGIAYAGKGQEQDAGTKAIHLAPNTFSHTRIKNLCKSGGISNYRGLVKIGPKAHSCRATVACDTLLLDNKSKALSAPLNSLSNSTSFIQHEARVSKLEDTKLHYLQMRGFTKEEATKMIIGGFVEPIVGRLPLEYAIELNRLIELEIEDKAV